MKDGGVFFPDWIPKLLWDLLGFAFIIYQSIVIPFRIGFNQEAYGFLEIFELMQDIYFGIDILITFNTGYYSKGVLYMKRRQIIFKYLRTWFLLDVAAVFPYSSITDLILPESKGGGNPALKTPQLLRLLKIVRFVRILRIIRIFKLGKLMYKIEEYIVTDTLTSMVDSIKLLTIILYVGHWLAGMFYFVGDYESSTEPTSWVTKNNILDADIFTKYMVAYYWAFTTMTTVGYGDLTPDTNNEMLFVMFAMIVAGGVFAYSVGAIGTIVNRPNIMTAEFRTRMLHINQFLIKKSIPNDLRIKIMSYLDYMGEYKRKYKLDEKEALDMLNDNLRDQVIAGMNGNMINKSGVFQAFNLAFLSQITFKLRHHTYAVEDTIIEEGTEGNKMYYIAKGTAILVHKKTQTFIREIHNDACGGELAFFADQPRRVTIRSKNFTEVLYLSREDFLKIAGEDEPSMSILETIQKKIAKKRNIAGIGVVCYVGDRPGHISLDGRDFLKIKGNINRRLNRLKTKDLPTFGDESLSPSRRKSLNSKNYSKNEYTSAQEQLIRRVIRDALFKDKNVDPLNLEKIVELRSQDEQSMGDASISKKRRSKRPTKSKFTT